MGVRGNRVDSMQGKCFTSVQSLVPGIFLPLCLSGISANLLFFLRFGLGAGVGEGSSAVLGR